MKPFKNSIYARGWCDRHAQGPCGVLLARHGGRDLTHFQAFTWTPETRLLEWAPLRQNVHHYACGCAVATAEPCRYYDHACADCYKTACQGKAW